MSRAHQNTALRSAECWHRYQTDEKPVDCIFCNQDQLVAAYKHWYIMENAYPYDTVAEIHHMLVPFEHVAYAKYLGMSANRELDWILHDLDLKGEYDCRIENFAVGKSQPQHYHIHLIKWKRV